MFFFCYRELSYRPSLTLAVRQYIGLSRIYTTRKMATTRGTTYGRRLVASHGRESPSRVAHSPVAVATEWIRCVVARRRRRRRLAFGDGRPHDRRPYARRATLAAETGIECGCSAFAAGHRGGAISIQMGYGTRHVSRMTLVRTFGICFCR